MREPYTSPMLGALLTFLACAGFAGLGRRVLSRFVSDLDPAAVWGLSGLFGLALTGWITLPIGLLPGGLKWGVYLVGGLGVLGLIGLVGQVGRVGRNEGPKIARPFWRWIFLAFFGLAGLFALVGVLGPSDTNDWDSLAYHLAVPKLWLQAGRIEFIPFIHHSNFPFLVDNLFIWGLSWGGQVGAKAFSFAYALFGAITLFGIARARYGEKAGWWAATAFVGIPIVLWEAGTAYIDAAHGLWSGLGILFAAEYLEDPGRKHRLTLSALCLGFACASKYTGLQVLIAVALVLVLSGAIRKRLGEGLRSGATVTVIGLVIAAPWLIKNAFWTGNPVYPFFYEVFGGGNWDQARADIYRHEQNTFGVGAGDRGRDWKQLPHAVLGLAYQPGRYVNPGQTKGLGMPIGALGVAAICALLFWPFSGRRRTFEKACLGMVAVCFVLWFALSQQSRYTVNMGVPLCVLLGGAVVMIRAGPLLAALASMQAAISMFWVWWYQIDSKLPVLLGRQSEEEYLARTVAFYGGAEQVNALPEGSKVALYDEVFGFLLDKPYFWANPGHSTQIPYERLENGDELAEVLNEQGFTHVFVNFAYQPPEQVQRWLAAAGISVSPPESYEESERSQLMQNLEQRWKPLLAEAIAGGRIAPTWTNGKTMLFAIVR